MNEDRALFLLQPDPDPDQPTILYGVQYVEGVAERRTIKSKAEVGFHQPKSEAMCEKRKKSQNVLLNLVFPTVLYVRHQSLRKLSDRVRLKTLTMNLQPTKLVDLRGVKTLDGPG